MKIGDLVRHRDAERTGLIVELTQKKCWRTAIQGKQVDWNDVDPEPHAVVLWSHNDGTIEIPIEELESVDESR